MTKVWIASVLNWFFPGLGWIILGRSIALAVPILLGMIGLTYVETSLQAAAPGLYLPMFVSVLVINTALAVECWQWGKAKVA